NGNGRGPWTGLFGVAVVALLAGCGSGDGHSAPGFVASTGTKQQAVTTYVQPIDFHLPSVYYDLPDLEQRLARYVADVNAIYARGTVRQFELGRIYRRDLPSPASASESTVPLVGNYPVGVIVDADVPPGGSSGVGLAGGQVADRQGE